MNSRSLPVYGLLIYASLRILSFITYQHALANQIIAGVLVLVFLFICLKNLKFGWLVLVGELLLDGVGHFFELNNLLLRTWFLGIFGIIWLFTKIKQKSFKLPSRNIIIGIIALVAVVAWSVVNGLVSDHATINILQDAILYLFILLIFPALEYLDDSKQEPSTILKSWIIGSALFVLLTYIIYSTGLGQLQNSYYHWFRDVAGGKITDLRQQFFRIVLTDQILLLPIILVTAAFLLKQPKNLKLWVLNLISIFILTLNFTRIYWIALAVGFIVLGYKQNLKQWITISVLTLLAIPIIFCSIHFISSGGQSIGLELLGLRINGLSAPQTDISGAIRLLMLPDIYKTIKNRPWLGSGFGATITYIDPLTNTTAYRTQYDWGYFEMIIKLGIVGTIIFLTFMFVILSKLARIAYKQSSNTEADKTLAKGLLAGAGALLIANVTTPALFQGFGILYIVFIIVFISRQNLEA